jgi:hypothetical protein
MKTIVLFALATVAAMAADVSGNINKLVGQNVPATAYVEMNILACPSPRVSEVAGQSVRLYFRLAKNAQGDISGTVLGNDKIRCSGTKSSVYNLTIRNGNTVLHSRSYKITGDKWNLNEATPLN